MVLRFLGEATTDSNGLAVLNNGYVGTGAGLVDIIAKTTIDESTIVSNTYPVEDCTLYDKGLSGDGNHNDSAWANTSNLTVFSRGSDGTTVTNNEGGNRYLEANITGGTIYDFTPPLRVKFNFEKLNTDSNNSQIQIFDSSNNNFSNWITATGEYIIDVKANEVTWTINGTAQTGKTVTFTGNIFVRFLIGDGASMKYSEFEIYPI